MKTIINSNRIRCYYTGIGYRGLAFIILCDRHKSYHARTRYTHTHVVFLMRMSLYTCNKYMYCIILYTRIHDDCSV